MGITGVNVEGKMQLDNFTDSPGSPGARQPLPRAGEGNGDGKVGPTVRADAHPESRVLYRIILEHAGYQVLEVRNGREALDVAHQAMPAVILVALTLPLLDGLQVVDRLKQDRDTASIPVILLTSDDTHETRREAANRGCDGILCKPCEPSQLLKEVHHHTRPRVTARRSVFAEPFSPRATRAVSPAAGVEMTG